MNDPDTPDIDEDTAEEPTDAGELRPRVTGKVAERFRAFHQQLRESDDLDHVKLAGLPTNMLIQYALCEWLKSAEAGLRGGRR